MKFNVEFTMAVETVQFLTKRNNNDYVQAEQIGNILDCSASCLQRTIRVLTKNAFILNFRAA